MLLLLCTAAGLVRRGVSRDMSKIGKKGKGKEGTDKGLLVFIVLILFVFVAILVGLLVFSLKQMQKGTAQPDHKDETNTKPSGNPNNSPRKTELVSQTKPQTENNSLSQTKPLREIELSQKNLKSQLNENNSLNEREASNENNLSQLNENNSLNEREPQTENDLLSESNLSPPSENDSLSEREASNENNLSQLNENNSLNEREPQTENDLLSESNLSPPSENDSLSESISLSESELSSNGSLQSSINEDQKFKNKAQKHLQKVLKKIHEKEKVANATTLFYLFTIINNEARKLIGKKITTGTFENSKTEPVRRSAMEKHYVCCAKEELEQYLEKYVKWMIKKPQEFFKKRTVDWYYVYKNKNTTDVRLYRCTIVVNGKEMHLSIILTKDTTVKFYIFKQDNILHKCIFEWGKEALGLINYDELGDSIWFIRNRSNNSIQYNKLFQEEAQKKIKSVLQTTQGEKAEASTLCELFPKINKTGEEFIKDKKYLTFLSPTKMKKIYYLGIKTSLVKDTWIMENIIRMFSETEEYFDEGMLLSLSYNSNEHDFFIEFKIGNVTINVEITYDNDNVEITLNIQALNLLFFNKVAVQWKKTTLELDDEEITNFIEFIKENAPKKEDEDEE